MPTTIPITFYTNASESTFVITAITRGDNDATPAGITLPISLAIQSPIGGMYPWTGSFTTTDSTVPPYYNAAGAINDTVTPPLKIFTSAVPPAGRWGTLVMVNSIYSGSNVSAWSIFPNSNVPDVSFQQGSFDRADNDIVTALSMQYYQAPPSDQSALSVNMGWIEAELMGAYLYEANGMQDKAKGMDGKIQDHRDNAMAQLDELMYFNRGGFTRVSGFADAPLNVAPNVRPDGSPVSVAPPYPVLAWTGWNWAWWSGGNLNPGNG